MQGPNTVLIPSPIGKRKISDLVRIVIKEETKSSKSPTQTKMNTNRVNNTQTHEKISIVVLTSSRSGLLSRRKPVVERFFW